MDQGRPVRAARYSTDFTRKRPRGPHSHSPWTAWLMSASLHTALLLGWFVLLLRHAPNGAGDAAPREVGIATVVTRHGEREYFQPTALSTESSAAQNAATVDAFLPASDSLAHELSAMLPGPVPAVGGAADTALPGFDQLTEGSGVGQVSDGSVRTEVFGVAGVGTKFVYVFDRSSSMAGFAGRPLRAAKNQLQASLADLDRIHQFQIIFYNQRPRIFHPFQGSPRLVWGDDDGKQLAAQFIAGIEADGGTRHLEALKLALQMQPDVVFFLTDADEPRLTQSQLRQVRHWNNGTTINAIEFGFGPSPEQDNFLRQLALQNGGAFVYVDIARWKPRRLNGREERSSP